MKRSRRWVAIVLMGLLGPLGVGLGRLAVPRLIQELELKTMDFRVRMAPPARVDPRVIMVVVDDPSLARFGVWPWPLKHHAALIRKLKQLGAAAIVYDFNIGPARANAPDAPEMIASMKAAGNVVLTAPVQPGATPMAISADFREMAASRILRVKTSLTEAGIPAASSIQLPPPGFLKEAGALGINPATPDPDGVFRRMPLLVSVDDGYLPALGLAALEPLKIWDLNRLSWANGRLTLAPFQPGSPTLRIPLDDRGNLLLNWAGQWDKIQNFSAQWLLDPAPPPEIARELALRLKGSICFVGASFTGGSDFRPQPFQTAYPMVGLHANVANNLLTAQFIRTAGAGTTAALVLFMFVVAVGLGLPRNPWASSLAQFLGLMVFLGLSFLALTRNHLLLPVVEPSLSLTISFIAITVYKLGGEAREARFLRRNFKNMLHPDILKQLLENPGQVHQRGERREITILFSDIKGFTTLSDKLEPEAVQELLTEYFGAMTEIIFRHQGTIDKFIGDGIMAFWGAPVPCPDHAVKAVRAAVEMQAAVRVIHERWRQAGRPDLAIRIGINTGFASVGLFGSARHYEYTALGSSVNMAARLESNCVPGNVLVSLRTQALVKDEFPSQPRGAIPLKGFADPVEVFDINCPPEDHRE